MRPAQTNIERTHTALAEVVLGGGEDPQVADAEFILKPSVPTCQT